MISEQTMAETSVEKVQPVQEDKEEAFSKVLEGLKWDNPIKVTEMAQMLADGVPSPDAPISDAESIQGDDFAWFNNIYHAKNKAHSKDQWRGRGPEFTVLKREAVRGAMTPLAEARQKLTSRWLMLNAPTAAIRYGTEGEAKNLEYEQQLASESIADVVVMETIFLNAETTERDVFIENFSKALKRVDERVRREPDFWARFRIHMIGRDWDTLTDVLLKHGRELIPEDASKDPGFWFQLDHGLRLTLSKGFGRSNGALIDILDDSSIIPKAIRENPYYVEMQARRTLMSYRGVLPKDRKAWQDRFDSSIPEGMKAHETFGPVVRDVFEDILKEQELGINRE